MINSVAFPFKNMKNCYVIGTVEAIEYCKLCLPYLKNTPTITVEAAIKMRFNRGDTLYIAGNPPIRKCFELGAELGKQNVTGIIFHP